LSSFFSDSRANGRFHNDDMYLRAVHAASHENDIPVGLYEAGIELGKKHTELNATPGLGAQGRAKNGRRALFLTSGRCTTCAKQAEIRSFAAMTAIANPSKHSSSRA
jgi:hypothetical protein